jgi:hypothetical protein
LKAVKALHETMAFDKAIERALEMVDFEDTLVIVTAGDNLIKLFFPLSITLRTKCYKTFSFVIVTPDPML